MSDRLISPTKSNSGEEKNTRWSIFKDAESFKLTVDLQRGDNPSTSTTNRKLEDKFVTFLNYKPKPITNLHLFLCSICWKKSVNSINENPEAQINTSAPQDSNQLRNTLRKLIDANQSRTSRHGNSCINIVIFQLLQSNIA